MDFLTNFLNLIGADDSSINSTTYDKIAMDCKRIVDNLRTIERANSKKLDDDFKVSDDDLKDIISDCFDSCVKKYCTDKDEDCSEKLIADGETPVDEIVYSDEKSINTFNISGKHTAKDIDTRVSECLKHVREINGDDMTDCTTYIEFPDEGISFTYEWDKKKGCFVGKQDGYDYELIEDSECKLNDKEEDKESTKLADSLKARLKKTSIEDDVVDRIFNATKDILDECNIEWFRTIYDEFNEISGVTVSSYSLCNADNYGLTISDIDNFARNSYKINKLCKRFKKELGFNSATVNRLEPKDNSKIIIKLMF